MYLRLFAHILVGFLIGALYYDIGNDGAKVLSNLGFLFFNMLFLMYTSMTITILSCENINLKYVNNFLIGMAIYIFEYTPFNLFKLFCFFFLNFWEILLYFWRKCNVLVVDNGKEVLSAAMGSFRRRKNPLFSLWNLLEWFLFLIYTKCSHW